MTLRLDTTKFQRFWPGSERSDFLIGNSADKRQAGALSDRYE